MWFLEVLSGRVGEHTGSREKGDSRLFWGRGPLLGVLVGFPGPPGPSGGPASRQIAQNAFQCLHQSLHHICPLVSGEKTLLSIATSY
eukprot:562068-Pyramimonas_sp.AAC.2